MHLGYNTWSMPMLPLRAAIDAIEAVGFDSLEISLAEQWPSDIALMGRVETTALKSRLDGSSLLLSGFTGNVPIIVPEAQWPANRDRLKRCLALAAELSQDGTPKYISTTTGHLEAWSGRADDVEQVLIDRFGQLAEDAAVSGAIIHLEPHVSTAVKRPEQAARIVDAVNNTSFRLTLDISHFLVQGDDELEVVNMLAPWIGAVEVKDQRGLEPSFQWLIPGEGTQDYPVFLRALRNAGYDGCVSAEISVLRQAVEDYDPLEAVVQTYDTLSRAFNEAGIRRATRSK